MESGISNLNKELKQKIVNTISHYEEKMQLLQGEMVILQSMMFHMMAFLKTDDAHLNISLEVNQNLLKLLDNLFIPEEMTIKLHQIKSVLNGEISFKGLSSLINDIAELVIDTTKLKQNQFKVLLEDISCQLHEFDHYLQFTSKKNSQAQSESQKLEDGLEANIQNIKSHVQSSKTIEELSAKINQNLVSMGETIKEFKLAEKKRFEEYEQQVAVLQEKLMASERQSETMRNNLFFEQAKNNHDSLTGLPNRSYYDEQVVNAFYRWQRGFGELSLAIADIDYFKTINDNYGHLAGDRVLKKVASIFKNNIRKVDFVARYGGEEFIFIFEHTSKENAKKILQALRLAVEDCQFSYQNTKVDVTASFGLTTIQEGDDVEMIFTRADAALYQAKHAGRNRVEVL